MKKALCVGINDYPGSANDLSGCVNDANDWAELLSSMGFTTEIVLNDQATRSNIVSKVRPLVEDAESGDVIVVTYSGHGTQVVDTSGDEEDAYDEALYVYDGSLLDDELREIIDGLKQGVHCVFICDSCFSGTVTRLALMAGEHQPKPRFMLTGVSLPHERRRKRFLEEEDMIEVLISGCSDSEYSYDAYIDGRWNGAMTAYAIKSIKANPDATYQNFYQVLRGYLPSSQYPQTPQLEGSSANKAKPLFEPTEDVEPHPEPEPEPDRSWLSKYWWAIVLAAIVGIIILLISIR
jgi:hypothetical protein